MAGKPKKYHTKKEMKEAVAVKNQATRAKKFASGLRPITLWTRWPKTENDQKKFVVVAIENMPPNMEHTGIKLVCENEKIKLEKTNLEPLPTLER